MNIGLRHLIYALLLTMPFQALAESVCGYVLDAADNAPIPFAAVSAEYGGTFRLGTTTDIDGFFCLNGLPEGKCRLNVSFVGYLPNKTIVDLKADTLLLLKIVPDAVQLREVVVTASEKKGMTSTSVINSEAMLHLQPSSFTDLLALLPGGSTKTPDMSAANTIKLREVGISDENYNTSSLGVKFVVDGAALNTDANLQYLPDSYQGEPDYARNHTSAGVDMRTISTDNIESVEIVRGIPSVKYGDLTSGLVKITRKNRKTPFEARIKADQFGKIIAVGKGMEWERYSLNLNTDAGFSSSRVDPRDPFKTYRRINFSTRMRKNWVLKSKGSLVWNVNADYTGSIDNVKYDPEIQKQKDEHYKSAYHNLQLYNSLKWLNNENDFLRSVVFSHTAGLSIDRITQTKFVLLDRDAVAPVYDSEGEFDGVFLPYKYLANQTVDGKPFYSTLRLDAEGELHTGTLKHRFSGGFEWQYSKNFGRGLVYDVTRPIYAGTAHRPRAYYDIPASSVVSFYVEDLMELPIARHKLSAMAGVRGSMMAGLSSEFSMYRRLFADPRINLQWDLPEWGGLQTLVSGGVGYMHKMPTIDILYPDRLFIDLTQLNYWHPNPDYKRINLRTYIIDRNNYTILPAHNFKWEVRMNFEYRKHSLSVTYFQEDMTDGFRNVAMVGSFSYKKYDTSGIDASQLTGPPSLENLPYEQTRVLRTYGVMQNGSRIYKEGVEFQYSSPRFPVVETRLTVNGAWFYDIYENSRPQFRSVSAVIGNVAVSDLYIGLYDYKDSYIRQQFTSNFIVDTYIDRLGVNLSATAECYIAGRYESPATGAKPIAYMGTDGVLREYTEEDAADVYKKHLNLTNNRKNDIVDRKRFYMCTNFKASKRFGKFLTLAFFADRILNYAPDYEVNGFVVRRTFSPYFGMELNFKL